MAPNKTGDSKVARMMPCLSEKILLRAFNGLRGRLRLDLRCHRRYRCCATQLARDMVTRYGMSDAMGTMVYAENEGEVFLGRSVTRQTNVSEETMRKVDAEIRRIIDEQYALARKVIEENRDKIEAMTKALLEFETIDADQIKDIMEGRPARAPKPSSMPFKPKSGGDSGGATPVTAVAPEVKPEATTQPVEGTQ